MKYGHKKKSCTNTKKVKRLKRLTRKKGGSTVVNSSDYGSDIIYGIGDQDETKIYDFVKDSLDDNEIPIIFRVHDEKNPKIYLFHRSIFLRNYYSFLKESIVYPCYQANNIANICEPGEPMETDPDTGEVLLYCPSDPLPDGIKKGMSNIIHDVKLVSLGKLVGRHMLNVRFKDLWENINGEGENPSKVPITLNVKKSNISYATLAKKPFVYGVGKLHCNAGLKEREGVYDIERIECIFTKEEEDELLEEYPEIFRKESPPLSPPPPTTPGTPVSSIPSYFSSNGSRYSIPSHFSSDGSHHSIPSPSLRPRRSTTPPGLLRRIPTSSSSSYSVTPPPYPPSEDSSGPVSSEPGTIISPNSADSQASRNTDSSERRRGRRRRLRRPRPTNLDDITGRLNLAED